MVIELTNIRKSYRMGDRRLEVLRGVSLAAREGEYIAIMGPSGSGKSTLLNLIGLLDTPDAGEYRLAGESVAGLSDNRLAKFRNAKIGFVFQNFNLFPQLTVLRNIEVPMIYAGVPRARRHARAKELAGRVGLAHRLTHRTNQLSGGEMQRTAIARSLANDPALILADEPTGNLDEKTGLEIVALFDELVAAGTTIVLVTHNPAYRKRVQRVVNIHNGEFVA
ncbi:MAG: ABC transporter ATP-binding protein [Planctomycetota bacterium]